MEYDDGQIDYSKYSLKELYEARSSINSERYPINANNIEKHIDAIKKRKHIVDFIAKNSVPYPYKNTSFLSLQHIKYLYTSWKGRINRERYWLGGIPLGIAVLLSNHYLTSTYSYIDLAIAIICFYPSIAINIKRSHDCGRSGHFCWLLFIPIISLWPMIEFGFRRGQAGQNKYGPDPLL